MANINAPEIKYYESFANEISGKFRRLQSLISHPGTSGDYHEEIIRGVLRNFLSKRFSVKKGFIYKGQGEASQQIDIIIVDENSPAAYIFQEGDFAIVMPDAVVAVIEVKTQLNKGAFKLVIENIAAAKKLMDFPNNLAGIVFSYSGGIKIDESIGEWFKETDITNFPNKEICMPNAIYCFQRNSLLINCDNRGRIVSGGKYYHWLRSRTEGEHQAIQLSVILALVVSACEEKDFKEEHFLGVSQGMNLIQAERGGLSEKRIGFGIGEITAE